MQTVDAATAAVLQSSIRAPRAYATLQVPVVTDSSLLSIDPAKLGGQLVVGDALELRMVQSLDIGADTIDLKVSNQDGSKSPLNATTALGRYYYPGSLDNKLQMYLGYAHNISGESVLPKGVYVTENFQQDYAAGQNEATINALDQFSMFKGQVYTQFPPRLYGNQQNAYYNPNYALSNPSGDLKTYCCDAVMWMQSASDSPLWKSDYVAVTVYTSDVSSGNAATSHSYTIDYNKGVVTFSAALPAGTIVSVDARPLAMAPEQMLKHLFVDFGSFDPNFLKFDSTGVYLPIMELARDRSILDVAKDIVLCTAPRGIRWRLYFDENGYMIFTEGALDGPPVKVLTDYKDILHIQPEYGSRNIKNVVTATARSAADQNLTAVAYDVHSISVFGQKPTYQIPSQLLATVAGMDSGSGINYMNGLVNSAIFELAMPQVSMEVEVLPDFSLQVGDPVGIIESKTGVTAAVSNKNILPFSNSLASPWLVNGPTIVQGDGPEGAAASEYTGTGSAAGAYEGLYIHQAVVPGTTYSASFWFDPSHITNNTGGQSYVSIGDIGIADINDTFLPASAGIGRYSSNGVFAPTNLIPYSDTFSNWTIAGSGVSVVSYNFRVTQKGGQFVGNGAAQTCDHRSPTITVTPGQTLYFTGWSDFSAGWTSSSDAPRWLFYDITHATEFTSIAPANGSAAAYHSQAITIPAGCTQIQVWMHFNGTNAASGNTLKWSLPALYTVNKQYYVGSETPQFQVAATLHTSAIVASGQKFKVSQPQFEAGPVATSYVASDPKNLGAWRQFFVQQITNELAGPSVKQTLRLTEVRNVQDYMYGIQAAIGSPIAQNPLAVNTQSGMVQSVTLQNGTGTQVQVVANGYQVLDRAFNPVLFEWNGGVLNIGITLATPPSGAQYYVWRWMYIAEDVFANNTGAKLATGDGSGANVWSGGGGWRSIIGTFYGINASYCAPYDAYNNIDSVRSRRFYWPLLRCSDWTTNDGVTQYGATTLNSSWTGGVGATNPQLYGQLRVGLTDAIGNTSSGFVGVQLYPTGSVGATNIGASSTVKYGVDFGRAASQTLYYGIKRKVTPCYLCILVANTAGGVQFKRIPFFLSI